MRVLLVDDKPEVLEQLRQLLTSARAPNGQSYQVQETTSYQEALKLIDDDPFDIVITDMIMGDDEEEGLDVLERLGDRSAVAIVLTGVPKIPNCVKSMRAGAWDYIEKAPEDGTDPYDRLLESMKQACEHKKKHPERGGVNPDAKWVADHMEELMRDHAGCVVAVLYERIVGSDESFTRLSRLLEEKFPLAKPVFISIPETSKEDGE